MKYLILFFAVSMSLNAFAQEKAIWQTDVVKAVDISAKENKPLFLYFTGSDWCGWCKRLQSEVFTQPKFQTWAKKNVILVELDFPRKTQVDPAIMQQNREIAQMFGIAGYPTVWFVIASKKDNQISFEKLGSTGYVAGGVEAWIENAEKILLPKN